MPRVPSRPRRDPSCDDTPSPRRQPPRRPTIANANLRQNIETWMDKAPSRSRRSTRGNGVLPYQLSPLRPMPSVEMLPESGFQLNDRSDFINRSVEADGTPPSSRRSYPRKAQMQKFRPATRASTEDVVMSAGYETPSEPESATEYQVPSPSSRPNDSTCPALTLSTRSEIDVDLDSNPTSNLRPYSLSYSGSATFTASNSTKWLSSQLSPSSQRSMSTFPCLTLSSGSELHRDGDLNSASVSEFRSSMSRSGSVVFLNSLSNTPQSSSYPPSLPAYISTEEIFSVGESIPRQIRSSAILSQVNGHSPSSLRSCLRRSMGQTISQNGTGNNDASLGQIAMEYDPSLQRTPKSVRIALPYRERAKQQNQLKRLIKSKCIADKEKFPDRWDPNHELYNEHLDRVHENARLEAEAEICEHWGIPSLESQIFDAEEVRAEESESGSEENEVIELDGPGTQLAIAQGTTDEVTVCASEREIIILDESESELEVEPDLGSAPVVERTLVQARDTILEISLARSREQASQDILKTMTAGVTMRSRVGLTETTDFVQPVQRPVHEQRRLFRKETPNTRLRRADQELILGLEAV